jgi:hypothetical protein
MYIPKHIKDLLDKTVNLAYDNDRYEDEDTTT